MKQVAKKSTGSLPRSLSHRVNGCLTSRDNVTEDDDVVIVTSTDADPAAAAQRHHGALLADFA